MAMSLSSGSSLAVELPLELYKAEVRLGEVSFCVACPATSKLGSRFDRVREFKDKLGVAILDNSESE